MLFDETVSASASGENEVVESSKPAYETRRTSLGLSSGNVLQEDMEGDRVAVYEGLIVEGHDDSLPVSAATGLGTSRWARQ